MARDPLYDKTMIRPYLVNKYGLKDEDIGWKQGKNGGVVSIKGYDFMDVPMANAKDGHTYADQTMLDEAINNYSSRTGYDFSPVKYQDKYSDKIDGMVNNLVDSKPFEYDVANDPLYQNIMKNAQQQGNYAFGDTVGQLSSMTGGRPNSYAASVGSSSRNAILNNVNEMIPKLEAQAYSRHMDGLNNQRNNISLISNLESQDYDRFTNEKKWDYDVANDEYNKSWNIEERDYTRNWSEDERDYNRDWNEDERGYSREWDTKNFNYNVGQDNIKNSQTNRNIAVSEGNLASRNSEFTWQKQKYEDSLKVGSSYTTQQLNYYDELLDTYLNSKKYSGNPEAAIDWLTSPRGEQMNKSLLGDDLYQRLVQKIESSISKEESTTTKKMSLSEIENMAYGIRDIMQKGDFVITEMRNAGYSDTAILSKLAEYGLEYDEESGQLIEKYK